MTEENRITLSVEQAAAQLGVSIPVLRDLTHKPGFPCFRIGRRVLIPRADLIEWVSRQAKEGTIL